MANTEAPKDYRDPYYASLAADVERREGLPSGLLASIITHGERSNADQVSEAGARTVAQIIPSTRKAALDKYGIDAYLSPQNALEVAGKLLKDSLARNDGDPLAAVAEYHGGTNRDNWGPRTTAYVDRVAQGLQLTKSQNLKADFAKWMADNPAVPAGSATAAVPAAAPSAPAAVKPLDAGFAQWLKTKEQSGADAIPGMSGEKVTQPTPAPDASTLEKIVGAGEAALNAGTGMTTGAVGMVGGTAKGLVDAVQSGNFGTPEGVRQVEQAAAQGADALTYTPRTAAGQEQAAAVGGAMQNAIPLAGIAGEVGAAGRAAQPVRTVAADAGRAVMGTAVDASKAAGQQIISRAAEMLGKKPEDMTPTPGTMGSVGAAGTDVATMRRANAQQLPAPIELTKGQAERGFEQQRFEQEMAKDPTRGQALRDRAADQHAAVWKNFDSWIDETGAQKTQLGEVGDAVKAALTERAQADKNKTRAAYKAAEKAGEMEQPVALSDAVNYLNENAPDASVAKVLDAARARALKLGVAIEDGAGNLVAQPVPLKTAELFRRAVSNATDYEPTNVRHSAQIKGLVDQATEGLGGNLYKEARALRSRYAQNYENIGLIYDLMNNKRGMADAKVAAEDVFRRSVLNSSMADVKQLRRILQTGGERGQQAWRELQGATLRHIRDEAARNISRNERGQEMVSVKGLDSAIQGLDKTGKLDFIFGKKGAEQLRAINDLAKDLFTAPPGAANHSTTASVILAALDIATSGIAGMPLPVMSGLRILTTHVRDRKIQHRINDALGIKPQPKKVKGPVSILPSPNTTRMPESRTQH